MTASLTLFRLSPDANTRQEISLNSERVHRWLTLAANLGVIVGLVFLTLEIRQTGAIASAQNRLDYAAAWRNIDAARQDKSFADLLAKSIDRPDSLSLTEFIQLDAYYWGVIDQMLSVQVAYETGVRDTPLEDAAREAGKLYFSNEFAKSWWKTQRDLWSTPDGEKFLIVMDEAIDAAISGRVEASFNAVQRQVGTAAKD